MKYFLVRENFIFVCLLLSIVFPMHRNNVCHEFLLFYPGHSMKSRRSQSIRIKGFFNERNLFNRKLNSFLQRSRNAMTVNVIIYINNTQKKDVTNKNYLCSHIVPPSLICGYSKLLAENECSVLQSTH